MGFLRTAQGLVGILRTEGQFSGFLEVLRILLFSMTNFGCGNWLICLMLLGELVGGWV